MYFVIQIPNSAKHNATQNNFANETLFLHKIITNKANKSIVNINGHTYTVEDRGGAITGNRIDIYMNSHAEALAWGVKYLPVQVAE